MKTSATGNVLHTVSATGYIKNRNETTNRKANKTSISNNDVINRMTEQNRFNLRTIRFGVEERRKEFERERERER